MKTQRLGFHSCFLYWNRFMDSTRKQTDREVVKMETVSYNKYQYVLL